MSLTVYRISAAGDADPMIPIEECHYCEKVSVSMAYDVQTRGLVPVCRDHILVYQVLNKTRWQAEDEWLDLQFARRSRWKKIAQMKLLHDQRVALLGGSSLFQRYRTWKANR